MLQVHHIDPSRYTDLDPQMFALLCSQCHETVERFIVSYFSPLYRQCNEGQYRRMMFELYRDFSIKLQNGKRNP